MKLNLINENFDTKSYQSIMSTVKSRKFTFLAKSRGRNVVSNQKHSLGNFFVCYSHEMAIEFVLPSQFS